MQELATNTEQGTQFGATGLEDSRTDNQGFIAQLELARSRYDRDANRQILPPSDQDQGWTAISHLMTLLFKYILRRLIIERRTASFGPSKSTGSRDVDGRLR